MDESEIVRKNYDDNPQLEWDRLEGFHFEFEITKYMLKKYLRKGSVLDVGGGPGRYSIFLAKLGFDVTLVDLSSKNVELALLKSKEHGVSIKAFCGDARNLDSLNLGTFDNVLVMGPLYHLFKESDRAKCILEAKKHLKKDGIIGASFISLSGGLNYFLDVDPYDIINEEEVSFFDHLVKNETWSGNAFTKATFINSNDIEPFFTKLGLTKITIFGQEGITGTRLFHIEKGPKKVRDFYLKLSKKMCELPNYFSHSHHLMYLGTIKD